ncbi:MAG: 1,4-beta-xylanase, partial [Lachnospiraceae bacterium]|nr:1,4-beta-xylanase [Lachnospiraceae bacterium]
MEQKYAGYLFVHFIGDQKDEEQIYFSLSRDGLHWQDLNKGEVMLRSKIKEAGARDPFLVRSPWEEGSRYFLIATDLRIEAGKGWQAAQYEGSRDILIWESEDLVNWK